MIVPPKMLATAAVSPSRMLMRIGFISRQRGSYQFSVLSSQLHLRCAVSGQGFTTSGEECSCVTAFGCDLWERSCGGTDMGESYKNLIAWAQGNGSGDRSLSSHPGVPPG